jgi:xylan 1,4-beta-xylosidase
MNIHGSQRQLRQGDIAVINSDEIHAINSNMNETGNSVFLLQIGSRFLQGFHLDCETLRCKLIIDECDAAKEIRRMLLLIIDELQARDTAYMVAVQAYCGNIIALLIRHFVQQEPAAAGKNQYPGNEFTIQRLKRIFTYIHQHYQESPSLGDIAEVAFVSPYYLSHFFTAAVGMSYSRYLSNIKIDMVRQDLAATTDSITEIMERHGFANTKTFNRVFKNRVGCTPRAYRKNTMIQNAMEPLVPRGLKSKTPAPSPAIPHLNPKLGSYVNFRSHINIPKELYREYPNERPSQSVVPVREIYPGIGEPVKSLDRYYRKMISAARASDILRASVREQLRNVQKEITFEYIHFHGIFNDEMGILPPGGSGKHYNFTYIDEIFDFLLSIGLRPFVELSFMPTALASGEKTVFFYRGNITPPKSWESWGNLVAAFIDHIIRRYTQEEVEHWYFEVWNESNLSDFWAGTFNDYMKLYRITSQRIKAAGPSIPVGGPAIGSFQYSNARSFLDRFLSECAGEKLPLDFISGHPYPAYYHDEDGVRQELLPGPDQSRDDICWIRERVSSSAYPDAELFLDEWNSSCRSDELLHDTAFMAPFLIQNYLSCQGLAKSLTYWAVSDVFEEEGVPCREFHGGFGLINKSGLKKPQYYAFIFLNRLGPEILCQDKEYIITRRIKENRETESIQVLAWNYVHYNTSYANGDRTKLDFYDRYGVFEKKKTMACNIIIPNPGARPCLIEKSLFDRNHGSIFDCWIKNGAVEYLSPRQLELLQTQCRPKQEMVIKKDCESLVLEIILPPFGFVFFDIKLL